MGEPLENSAVGTEDRRFGFTLLTRSRRARRRATIPCSSRSLTPVTQIMLPRLRLTISSPPTSANPSNMMASCRQVGRSQEMPRASLELQEERLLPLQILLRPMVLSLPGSQTDARMGTSEIPMVVTTPWHRCRQRTAPFIWGRERITFHRAWVLEPPRLAPPCSPQHLRLK